MNSSDAKSAVKRLGELLLESGCVHEEDLVRCLEIGRRNYQLIGKVLIAQKVCLEVDVHNALEIQKICKFEGMSSDVAVRALTLIKNEVTTLQDGLKRVGWTADNYVAYAEPENILKAKREFFELGETEGRQMGLAIENIGDAYAANKLSARAESKYAEALAVFENCNPVAVREIAFIYGKLCKLAIADRRHSDAEGWLEKAKTLLRAHGFENSRVMAKLLYLYAEQQVARRKYYDADSYYRDCFNMIEVESDLEDAQLLGIVRSYADIMLKAGRRPEKVTVAELLKGARLVTDEQMSQAWQFSKREKVSLGQALVSMKIVAEKELQIMLQVQVMVESGELTPLLGVWLFLYSIKLGKSMDAVLEMFKCLPKSRALLSSALKQAADKVAELQKRLQEDDPELAFASSELARIHFERQEWDDAELYFSRAFNIIQENPEIDSERAITLVERYRDLKLAQEDWSGSLQLSKFALELRSSFYGDKSEPYAKGLKETAEIFCRHGDHVRALSHYNWALGIFEKINGSDSLEVEDVLERKGDCFTHAADYAGAEAAYDLALKILDARMDRNQEDSSRVVQKLVRVCTILGKYQKVGELGPQGGRDLFTL